MRILSVLIVGSLTTSTFGQNTDSLGIDCNPTLNKQEIAYLDQLFSEENYDFQHKKIGFASPNVIHLFGVMPMPPGFNDQLLPVSKKEYFLQLKQEHAKPKCSELLILTDSLKAITKGFDAIVIFIPEKKRKKVNAKTAPVVATTFGYRDLNYPDNLQKVGADTSSALNKEEVAFLNQIYQHYPDRFDFSNKKIAVVDQHSEHIVAKQDYFNRIKKHLGKDFLYPTDDLILLNESEKQETGYDAVILLPEKMINREKLIEFLKMSRNRP